MSFGSRVAASLVFPTDRKATPSLRNHGARPSPLSANATSTARTVVKRRSEGNFLEECHYPLLRMFLMPASAISATRMHGVKAPRQTYCDSARCLCLF